MKKEGDSQKINLKLDKATYIIMICVATLMCLLLLAIMIFFIYTFTNLNKDKQLNLIFVKTSYMEPKVHSNSFIAFNEDYESLQIGDIVIVEYEDGIYVQEITNKQILSERIFYSAKDNNSERIFVENNVYGVYEKTLTTLTGFTRFCRSFWGILVMIIIPVGTYISLEIYFWVNKPKYRTTIALAHHDNDAEEMLESKIYKQVKYIEQNAKSNEVKESERKEKNE